VATADQRQTSDHGLDVLRGLAERVLGDLGGAVVWKRLPANGAAASGRRFEFAADGGSLVVGGSDLLGAALGLHEYLKTVVGRRVCWDTPLPLPVTSLPDVEASSGTARAGVVYYLNFCTFSYTTAYWGWARWEREIDWMALHGVSMPLAAVGHEAVLAQVYRELGLSDDEIVEFLGGPGYLPFQFMGCLDGWAGPLPTHWLHAREALGARIIGRQREYGMTPVLPAFTGHVPQSLAGPDTARRSWSGFSTRLLAPHDPRFTAIAQRVVEVQRELFEAVHLYAADPFIEMSPPSDDARYLADLATALVSGLRAGDPEAVWLMQAWTFSYLDYWTDDRIAAFLDAVPDDAMVLLDLWGEHSPQWRRFDGFRGKPWVWCALHNFGGRSDVFGNARITQQECEAAQRAASPPVGVGLAMEAIEQNPVIYEMVLDLAREPIADLNTWVRDYSIQRYGVEHPRAAAAWGRLLATVYDAPADRSTPDAPRGSVTLRPTFAEVLDEGELGRLLDAACWYDPTELFEAWRDLLDVASTHPEMLSAELGHDLVSIAATAVVRACDRLLIDVVTSWHHRQDELAGAGDRFLAALHDLDTLLATRPELQLTTWEMAAAAHAHGNEDRRVLLDNARRIISVWDTSDRVLLTDYSARLWSGLVEGLYLRRWRVWIEELTAAVKDGRPPDEPTLTSRVNAVTDTFIAGIAPHPPASGSDPLTELRRLFATYETVARPTAATNPHENEIGRA
jgi:alpha-N-acetylglucosaminidase